MPTGKAALGAMMSLPVDPRMITSNHTIISLKLLTYVVFIEKGSCKTKPSELVLFPLFASSFEQFEQTPGFRVRLNISNHHARSSSFFFWRFPFRTSGDLSINSASSAGAIPLKNTGTCTTAHAQNAGARVVPFQLHHYRLFLRTFSPHLFSSSFTKHNCAAYSLLHCISIGPFLR